MTLESNSPASVALWATAVLVPLVVVLVLAAAGWGTQRRAATVRRILVRFSPVALVPTGAIAVLGPGSGTVDAPWLVLGTSFAVTPLGRPLLLLTVVLYAGALLAVYFGGTARKHLLTGFLLVGFLGNAGVFVAADTITFYLAFALMSVAAFGCVVHTGSEAARRAGRIYLSLTMVSELAVLCALVMIVDAGGRVLTDAPAAVAGSDHRDVIVGLLLVGFGIKAGTVPLHVWLPLAHPAAPPPASAVLSGAMVKAGLYGWISFLPLGEIALPGWGAALVTLALLGAFLALPAGIAHRDPKVPLAYSTISQMGFLALLVGIALAEPDLATVCVSAAVVYAVHHGVAKGGLFLGVAVWQRHGRGPARVAVLVVLALLALAVAGAPLGSGSVAKYAAKQAVDPADVFGLDFVDVLPWVGTVSTLLLARAGWVLLRGPRGPARSIDAALLAWVLLTVTGTVATWALADRWSDVVAVPDLDLVTVWDAAWPILVGLAVAGLVAGAAARGLLPDALTRSDGSLVPPGDLVVPEERLLARAASIVRGAGIGRLDAAARRVSQTTIPGRVGAVVDSAERGLSRWAVSGVCMLAVAAVLLSIAVIA